MTLAKFGELEVDEGKKKEKGDLEALVAAVANPTPSFSSAVAPVANLDEMARMWAAEKYSGQWDGYSGQTGEKQPNNYYLYSDASGSFQMLPWGTDETWGKHIGFEAPGGVLFNGCRGDGACKATYRQALTTALTTLNALGLDDAVRCAAARLQPWQLLEAAEKSSAHPERVPFSAGQIASGVASTRDFIADRPVELASFLEMSAPASPPPTLPCTDPASGPRCPPAGRTLRRALGCATGSARSVSCGRVQVGPRAVHLHLTAPAAGEVVLYGWVGAGKKHATACTPARLGVTAGTADITCKLTDPVLRRRAKHRLRLHLKVDFLPSSGTPQEIRSDLTLPKRGG